MFIGQRHNLFRVTIFAYLDTKGRRRMDESHIASLGHLCTDIFTFEDDDSRQ